MLKIISFNGHTISALSLVAGDRLWEARYTVCDRGVLVQNSRKVAILHSHRAAEISALIQGIQYVQARLSRAQNGSVADH